MWGGGLFIGVVKEILGVWTMAHMRLWNFGEPNGNEFGK